MNKIPRSTPEAERLLRSLVPDAKEVTVRPMFGNVSAFVNGNMYAGVFGDDLFVRLSPKDGTELLKEEGAAYFEPMKGRPMRGYVVVPRGWSGDARKVEPWMNKALESARKLPRKARRG